MKRKSSLYQTSLLPTTLLLCPYLLQNSPKMGLHSGSQFLYFHSFFHNFLQTAFRLTLVLSQSSVICQQGHHALRSVNFLNLDPTVLHTLDFLLPHWSLTLASLQALNMGASQSLMLLSVCSSLSSWLVNLSQCHGFKYHLNFDNFHNDSFSPDLLSKLKTCISKCLLYISVWISQRYFKLNPFNT